MMLPERRARRSLDVLKIAALVLASVAGVAAAAAPTATVSRSASAAASADSSSTLVSAAPWWEKVTVTMDGNGKPEACSYQTSINPAKAEDCDVGSEQAAMATKESAQRGELTRITFERRFTPGEAPGKPDLHVGDTLLGGQVMALAIDARGAVKNCKIVAASGAMRPEYGCDDASAEKFQASYGAGKKQAPEREGYMTILVYGHSEHMA
jgi:hypothetical protein